VRGIVGSSWCGSENARYLVVIFLFVATHSRLLHVRLGVELNAAHICPECMQDSDLSDSADPRSAITICLRQWREGDPVAKDRLFELVYEHLRQIAHQALRRERDDHTLATTDLVHEAYIRLVDHPGVEWQDSSHFFAVASRAMRRILVDYARKRGAAKRGSAPRRVPLMEETLSLDEQADTLLALDEALTRLHSIDERLAQVVEHRFFGGLTEEQTAQILSVTARTVRRDWVKARGWLYRELSTAEASPG
jgi:RNA polymerase sigma factor (TIGR02999 family)